MPEARVSPKPAATSAVRVPESPPRALAVCSTKLSWGATCSWMRTAMLASAWRTPAVVRGSGCSCSCVGGRGHVPVGAWRCVKPHRKACTFSSASRQQWCTAVRDSIAVQGGIALAPCLAALQSLARSGLKQPSLNCTQQVVKACSTLMVQAHQTHSSPVDTNPLASHTTSDENDLVNSLNVTSDTICCRDIASTHFRQQLSTTSPSWSSNLTWQSAIWASSPLDGIAPLHHLLLHPYHHPNTSAPSEHLTLLSHQLSTSLHHQMMQH